MKKLIFIVLLIALVLLIRSGVHETLLGASTVSYHCTDNNADSATPLQTKGTITVTSSDAERASFSDYCLDRNTLREYSCDSETGKHSSSDHLCSNFDQVCRLGRCMDE